MQDTVFRKFYARLKREGIVKALLWGIAIGFVCAFIVAFATWMSYFGYGFFVASGVFVLVAAGVAVGAYYLFFKPTARSVARRVDALGLEERIITMLELENDNDYIAMRQREDAQAALNKLGMSKLKFSVSLTLILVLSIGGACGLAMTTVTGLSDLGIIPSGAQLIDEAKGNSPKNFIEVTYAAMSGGDIYGEVTQTIKKTEKTKTVIAVPKDGYRFYRWTDGYLSPARSDGDLDDSITFTAWFLPIDGDEAEERPSGDRPNDMPPEDGNDADEEETPPPGGTKPPNYDYVYDWTVEYRLALADYYQSIMDELASDGEISDLERRFIETYFNTIQ